MITKTTTDREFEPFPEFPPRDDMQNWNHLYKNSQATAIALHLGDGETTTVVCEAPVGLTLDNHRDIRIPDLTVARNSKPDLILEHGGYAIDRQGKPPDFVLEVASKTTGVIDYTGKRIDYERYGIAEYWRFDSTGGLYHDVALAGDRLVGGRYRPIAVEWIDESRCRGYSEALGLHLCWEYGELRFYDPETGSYLRTHDEEVARADAAVTRVGREAAARRQAEAEREAAEARATEAETELRRLRERLSGLGDAE